MVVQVQNPEEHQRQLWCTVPVTPDTSLVSPPVKATPTQSGTLQLSKAKTTRRGVPSWNIQQMFGDVKDSWIKNVKKMSEYAGVSHPGHGSPPEKITPLTCGTCAEQKKTPVSQRWLEPIRNWSFIVFRLLKVNYSVKPHRSRTLWLSNLNLSLQKF